MCLKNKRLLLLRCITWLALLCTVLDTRAAASKVAVASNFMQTAQVLWQQYKQQTNAKGDDLLLISGATSKLYQQILQGAPFSLFLAADRKHPSLLVKRQKALADSKKTYAIGRLALWQPQGGDAFKALQNQQFNHLSLADARIAPYGLAAQQVLQQLGLWQPLKLRLVTGKSVSQALHFVYTRQAQLGFVAYSQLQYLRTKHGKLEGDIWLPPRDFYQPIEQQMVLLKTAQQAQVAHDFWLFIQTRSAQRLITQHGYETQ